MSAPPVATVGLLELHSAGSEARRIARDQPTPRLGSVELAETRRALRGLNFGLKPFVPSDWRRVAAAAAGHGLCVPLMQWFGPVLPSEAHRWMEYRNAASSALFTRKTAMAFDVIRALAEAGVPSVPLKGAVFAHRYYDPPYARPTTDIDVLIDPDMLDTARSTLLELGYTDWTKLPRDLVRRHYHHLEFTHPEWDAVELHFAACSAFGVQVPSRTLLERAVVRPVNGVLTNVLESEDEFVYLAVHAGKHRYSLLRWTYDLVLLARAHGLTAPALLERADRLGVRTATLVALHQLAEIAPALPGTPPLGLRGRLASRVATSNPMRQSNAVCFDLLGADGPLAVGRSASRSLLGAAWRRLSVCDDDGG